MPERDEPCSLPPKARAQAFREAAPRCGRLGGIERHGHGAGAQQAQEDFQPTDSIGLGEDDRSAAQSDPIRGSDGLEPGVGAGIEFLKGGATTIGGLHDGALGTAGAQRFFPSLEQGERRHERGGAEKALKCSNSIVSSAASTIRATVSPRARTTGMPLHASDLPQ